jgi:hypothetical protein
LVDGASWTSTIPAGLMPGQYVSGCEYLPKQMPSHSHSSLSGTRCTSNTNLLLVQHLVPTSEKYSIALHSATPQFYPSCS